MQLKIGQSGSQKLVTALPFYNSKLIRRRITFETSFSNIVNANDDNTI